MAQRIFFHGLSAGVLAAIASLAYRYVYQNALGTAFESVLSPTAILASCILSCALMALGYYALYRLKKEKLQGALNLLICILSFASILGPIGMSLPLDIDFPELFPGLVIPMHFFPGLAFFALAPFFDLSKVDSASL